MLVYREGDDAVLYNRMKWCSQHQSGSLSGIPRGMPSPSFLFSTATHLGRPGSDHPSTGYTA